MSRGTTGGAQHTPGVNQSNEVELGFTNEPGVLLDPGSGQRLFTELEGGA